MILIVCLSDKCVWECVCVGVYDSPISCFFTYRSLNAILQCSHSMISWMTHTHLQRVDLNLVHTHNHTLAFCSFLCTFSGSLCQTGGPLSSFCLSLCLWLSFSSFLYISVTICLTHTRSKRHVHPHTYKQVTSRIVALP